jgi:hypothetical protein
LALCNAQREEEGSFQAGGALAVARSGDRPAFGRELRLAKMRRGQAERMTEQTGTQGRALLLDSQISVCQRDGSADHRFVAAAELKCASTTNGVYPAQREGERTRNVGVCWCSASSLSVPNDGGRACRKRTRQMLEIRLCRVRAVFKSKKRGRDLVRRCLCRRRATKNGDGMCAKYEYKD